MFFIILLILAFALLRKLVVDKLGSVKTREPDTLAKVRFVLKILFANEKQATFVMTKDRGNAGLSRRRKPKLDALRQKKQQQKVLEQLRVRMANKLHKAQ
jgi:hypothetical protein